MQEDKCDFEVFFNNAVGKCNVIDQSRAGNHFAGLDLFAFGNSFMLRQIG